VTDKSAETEPQPRTLPRFGSGWRGRLSRKMKVSVKKLLPDAVVREIQIYRAYEVREKSTYLKLRLGNGFGLAKPKLPRIPVTTRSIVFVCFGNIIRSPAAEALMKQALEGRPDLRLNVTSAGLNAVPGRAAHPWAIAAARELGVSLEHHQARLLTTDLVTQADVIFAMDYQNQVQLLSRWTNSKNKVFMLSAYAADNYRSVEIRDPYYFGLDETRRCYDVLNTCVRNLVSTLSGESPPLV
jgi:protein-tyrosine phosphatase